MAQQKKSKSSKNKKNNGTLFSVACVVLALLVLLVVFLVKKDEIFSNLKDTAFFERIFGATPTFVENHESTVKKDQEIPLKSDVTIKLADENESDGSAEGETVITLNDLKGSGKAKATETSVVTDASGAGKSGAEETSKAGDPSGKSGEAGKEDGTGQTAKSQTAKAGSDNKASETTKTQSSEKAATTKAETKPAAKTTLELCFVLIDGDGTVGRKLVKREIAKNDSPLTTAIKLLLQGPDTTKAAERNCMTLIPSGTKLLGAKVQNGVAYLSFNDAFTINTYGVEGYIHQLEQIVYTATSFSTVQSVQFLINGEKIDYLGSEGQWIGSPLSRTSF